MSDGQIKSYFDRWQAESPESLAEILRPYEARVSYVVDRLAHFRDVRTYGMDRALIAGGRMLGLGKRAMRRHLNNQARNAGRVSSPVVTEIRAEIEADRKRRALDAVPDVSEFCGYVYRARLVHFPHIFKIGFTTQPEKSEQRLCYEARTAVEMETVEVGTLFEEAFRLLIYGRFHIRGEWFFDPHMPIHSMPEFLGCDVPVDRWREAAKRNFDDGANGRDTLGALSQIYLQEFHRSEAA